MEFMGIRATPKWQLEEVQILLHSCTLFLPLHLLTAKRYCISHIFIKKKKSTAWKSLWNHCQKNPMFSHDILSDTVAMVKKRKKERRKAKADQKSILHRYILYVFSLSLLMPQAVEFLRAHSDTFVQKTVTRWCQSRFSSGALIWSQVAQTSKTSA